MSGLAAHYDRPLPSRTAAVERPMREGNELTQGLLRLATFLPLAAFAAGHWVAVVGHPPFGRTVALLALCGAGGAALWLSDRLELPDALLHTARALLVLGMAVAGLLLIGLPARYLTPHGWGPLARGIDRGLIGAQTAVYPYHGDQPWVRLTLLLAAPTFLVPAAALAFWPARRAAPALRFAALALLTALYGMALAELSPRGQVGRGLVLLLLIAAWLWLPRLRTRDAAGAGVAILAAAIVALPAAAALDGSKGWLDYRNWRLIGKSTGVGYDWNHSYGPIDWPRRGTTLLYVKANRPYYWKAEALSEFDGRRWIRSNAYATVGSGAELPAHPNTRWYTHIEVSVAALRGNVVIGAGSPQEVSDGAGQTAIGGDGTVTSLGQTLHSGQSYSEVTYIPEPTAAQMRAAPASYESYYGIYTRVYLPLSRHDLASGVASTQFGFWGDPSSGDPAASRLAERSPYAGMYRLANRLAAGAATPYDVALKIEGYLDSSSRFSYDERPTLRKWPLEAFVTKDRVGYCQQFSGAMAMMLRMEGVPARVVTGFAPGTPQTPSGDEYKVRDLDAHSWVEAYFPTIGWYTFDPTPAVSPASLQTDDLAASGRNGGPAPRGLGQSQGQLPAGSGSAAGLPGAHHSWFEWWMVPAGAAVLGGLTLLAAWLTRRLRRRAGRDPQEAALDDLRSALARLGTTVLTSTTLSELERQLDRRAGPAAARYARLLRDHRYGSNGAALPHRKDRRALRSALARSAGRLGRLKALRALPPLRL